MEMINQGSPVASGKTRSLRILLVDDHEDTLALMTRMLSLLGHQVKTAGTVATALEAAGAEAFNCIISDLGLPDGSGLDLMRQIRARSTRPIRGIAITGAVEHSDIDQCRAAGFSRHISKPVNMNLLEDALRDGE